MANKRDDCILLVSPDNFPYQENIKFKLKGKNSDIPYIFSGKWCAIDNFYIAPVTIDVGRGHMEYPSSEHAFAAAKAKNRTAHDLIRDAANPGIAKSYGRKAKLREAWDFIKFQVMLDIVRAKMDQVPEAREVLLATGERRIYEGNSWKDDIWGVITDNGCPSKGTGVYRGRNALGEILMMVRTEILSASNNK